MKTYKVITKINGEPGEIHSSGASAYEVAVFNGFKGTQKEWLESLKGTTGDKGADGISSTIVENENNDEDTYKLDITDKNGTFTTPNLKGGGGDASIDDENSSKETTYSSNKIEEEVKPLKEASHTHANKEILDRFYTATEGGDSYYFDNGLEHGLVAVIDDTNDASGHTLSASKIYDLLPDTDAIVNAVLAKLTNVSEVSY